MTAVVLPQFFLLPGELLRCVFLLIADFGKYQVNRLKRIHFSSSASQDIRPDINPSTQKQKLFCRLFHKSKKWTLPRIGSYITWLRKCWRGENNFTLLLFSNKGEIGLIHTWMFIIAWLNHKRMIWLSEWAITEWNTASWTFISLHPYCFLKELVHTFSCQSSRPGSYMHVYYFLSLNLTTVYFRTCYRRMYELIFFLTKYCSWGDRQNEHSLAVWYLWLPVPLAQAGQSLK